MEINFITYKSLILFVEQLKLSQIPFVNCSRETAPYVPKKSLWINRLFISLANRNDNVCLTIDRRGINSNGPGKFRTKVDEAEQKHCYFNIKANDKLHNTFISNRIRNSTFKIDSVYFQLERVLGESKTSERSDATAKLKEFLENGASAIRLAESENRNRRVRGKLDENSGTRKKPARQKFLLVR